MLAPVTVTFFTGNAQHIIPGIPHGAVIYLDRKRGAVTFQAARDDEPPKVDLAVRIARAICPLLDAREIRDRQLEQEPAPPVEIGLPSSPGPDHQIDTLRSPRPSARVNAGLVESTIALLHDEVHAFSTGAEQVMPFVKTCFDGSSGGLGGGAEVSRLNERRENLLVACPARARLLPQQQGCVMKRCTLPRDGRDQHAEHNS